MALVIVFGKVIPKEKKKPRLRGFSLLRSTTQKQTTNSFKRLGVMASNQKDPIKYAVAAAVIFAFLFDVIAVVFIDIPSDNKEIFVHMMGMIDAAFIGGLVAFYYTKSSVDKENNRNSKNSSDNHQTPYQNS